MLQSSVFKITSALLCNSYHVSVLGSNLCRDFSKDTDLNKYVKSSVIPKGGTHAGLYVHSVTKRLPVEVECSRRERSNGG